MSKKILVTGFGPFLQNTVNPTEKIIESLMQDETLTAICDFAVLPVEFERSVELVKEKINLQSSRASFQSSSEEYKAVLLLGLAAGREKICLERVGLNWLETESADVSGFLPKRGFIHEAGPQALFTGLDINHFVFELKNKNIPVEVSLSAGGYVCNHLYYNTLKHFGDRVLFVHVPNLPEFDLSPDRSKSLSLETMLEATRFLISRMIL